MATLDEMKAVIEEFLTTSKRSKHYFNSLSKAVKKKYPDVKTRDVKKAANALVDEGKVAYFSTGSTTFYVLAGREDEASE